MCILKKLFHSEKTDTNSNEEIVIKEYGAASLSYRVSSTGDDKIRIYVLHKNERVRDRIERNIDHPEKLLESYEAFKDNYIRALYWLALVMEDFREYFEDEKVIFIIPEYEKGDD